MNALGFQNLGTPHAVGEPFVAAIDNEIALFHVVGQLGNRLVDRLSGLYQNDHLAGFFEFGTKVCHVLGPDQRQVAFVLGSLNRHGHLGGAAVARGNLEPVRGHVEGKVLSHDGQSPQPNVALFFFGIVGQSRRWLVGQWRSALGRLDIAVGIDKDVFFVADITGLFGNEPVRFGWTASPKGVRDGPDGALFNLVQEWRKDFPGPAEFVVADKGSVFALQHVENQTGVGIGVGHLAGSLKEAAVVIDFEFRLNGFGGKAGALDIGLHVHRLVGLEPHHQFVAGTLESVKHVVGGRGVLELDAHLGLALVESLASLENNGHSVPTRGVDPHAHQSVRWGVGVLVFNSRVVGVSLVLS